MLHGRSLTMFSGKSPAVASVPPVTTVQSWVCAVRSAHLWWMHALMQGHSQHKAVPAAQYQQFYNLTPHRQSILLPRPIYISRGVLYCCCRYQASQGVPAAIHATCAAGGSTHTPESGSHCPHSGNACTMVSCQRETLKCTYKIICL